MPPAQATATTNLYEILGIRRDATQEEVRKAYKKRALQTHPDRLPQNIGPADKQAAEEQFRLVNNAYEVLNNEDNRKLYDRHGVWPPPTEQPAYPQAETRNSFGNNPFSNGTFFNAPFGSRSQRGYMFTDPFELFNSLFGDLHSAFENDPIFVGTPFFRSPFDDPFFRSAHNDPFSRSPFGGPMFGGSMFGGSMFGPGSPFGGMLMGGSMFPQIESGSNSRMYSSSTEAVGQNGQWISRSQMTRTVNGRTEVITKRVDTQGNEHVTYSSPEGERYTINGVDQPSQSTRPVEGPRRSETAPQPRQPPQAIADAPTQPASHFIPQQQQAQAYNVPIAGPAQTQAPPPNNAYLDRAHSHRSRHSSHRDRHSAEDAPRRSYTTRTSSASPRPPADPRVAGHARTDSAPSPPRGVPTAMPAERSHGGYDQAAANGYDASRNSGAYVRDPRRESAHSGHTHPSVDSGKTRYPHRSSRHDSMSPEHARDRDREGAPPATEEPGHSRRGWRGW
ncbi:DnaJ-domain-containing protein [Trametes versicolor FP-101664 SS1]|uniref:DnaJ-domain-containing protein n=1 Tax=Trametes versicolor (strain FP-101664) TaxID=717944 RepID=UPI0004622856|nr:DnaJ-domain-containing protein [Trametes versicolor FP-101664 SS1]EIW58727.1 DnaJ-domain-containing protein [Trametes versicolor FP-101664 SS1]